MWSVSASLPLTSGNCDLRAYVDSGSVSEEAKQCALNEFRQDPECTVALVSFKAGGQGMFCATVAVRFKNLPYISKVSTWRWQIMSYSPIYGGILPWSVRRLVVCSGENYHDDSLASSLSLIDPRIGQTRPVEVHKLYTENSVDERVLAVRLVLSLDSRPTTDRLPRSKQKRTVRRNICAPGRPQQIRLPI